MIISGRSYLLNYVSGKFIELPSNQIVLGDRNYLYGETGIAIGKFNYNSGIVPTGYDDFFAASAAIGYANFIDNEKENFTLGFANLSYNGNSKYVIGRLNSLGSGFDVYTIGASNNLNYSTSIEAFGSNNFILDSNTNYIFGDSHFISGGETITNIGNSNYSENNQFINLFGLINTDINGSNNNLIGINNTSNNNSNANLIGNSNSVSNSNNNILLGISNFANSGNSSLLIGFSNNLVSSTYTLGFVNIEDAGLSYINQRYYPIDNSTGIEGVYSVDPLNPFATSTIYNDGTKWKIFGQDDGQDIYYSTSQFYNPWEVTDWGIYDPAWDPAPVFGGVTYQTESIIDGNVGSINTLIGNSNLSLNPNNSFILGNNNTDSNISNTIIGSNNSNIYSGSNNFFLGNSNVLDNQPGTGNYIGGNNNFIRSSNSNYIAGNVNSIYNIGSSVLVGNSNYISGNSFANNFINVGSNNTLNGNSHLSIGNNNSIDGDSNSVFGTSNLVGTGSQSCIILGRNQTITGLNEVGKIKLGTSSNTNLTIKLDKVEITSLLDPTINDKKILTSDNTGEFISSDKLASYEYLSLSGQSFGSLDIVDNEMDHLAHQINILDGGLNVSYLSYYTPNSGFSGIRNGEYFTSIDNFYKTSKFAYQGFFSVSGNYYYHDENNKLDIIYTTSLSPSRWIIANSTGLGYYFYNNGGPNDFPLSDWIYTSSSISNSGFNPTPTFSSGILTSNVNQKYTLVNNFATNFNPIYTSALSNYYKSEDNYFSLIYGNNLSGNLFPIANSESGLKLNSQWMIIETIGSGLYYFIDTTGSNFNILPYTGFVSTGQNLLLTGQGVDPNPQMTLQIGSRTGIIGSFHPDFGRIYVPFYY